MSSFRYPQQMLHGYMEPQWLPRSNKEKESSLDALERAEENYMKNLRRTVLPVAPEPLGLDSSSTTSAGGASDHLPTSHPRSLLLQQPTVDLKAIPPRPPFWEQYKDKMQQMQQQQQEEESPTEESGADEAMDLSSSQSSASLSP